MRRYTIILLLVLTLGLAGASVYIGYELSTQDQAPEESEAAGGVCTDCGGGDMNACCDPNGVPCTTDQQWLNGWTQCNGGTTPTGCTAETAADKRSITLKNGCSNVAKKRYVRSYSGTSVALYPDCITNDSNGTGEGIVYVGDGTYSPDASAGTCVQIDTDNPNGSACECIPPAQTTPSCGDGTLDAGEECEVGIACSGENEGETCNESTCTCTPEASATCGDGTCDANENCESPGATGGIQCPSGDPLSVECRTDCTYCGDGVVNGTEECDHGGTPTAICDANCELVETQDTQMCVSLERATTDPVGPNEIELFAVQVSTTGTTIPYDLDQVKLRVSLTTDDVAVGEDFYVPGQGIATARYVAQVSETNWEYHFAWQASSLANGNYEVEVSFDGGTTWDDTAACIHDFTYDAGDTVDPSFIIVKTGTAVCSTAGGATLTYTLTVTNLGPGSGVITNVVDEIDANIQDSWVTNITSSTGVTGTISNGVITWTGTEEQRTFAENESQTYSYTVNVPSASLSVVNDGVENIATVLFSDDQVRYNYYMNDICGTTPTLPSTGFIDEAPWILGITAMLIGMIALRLGGGEEYIYPAIRKIRFTVFTRLGLKSIEAHVRKAELEDRYR